MKKIYMVFSTEPEFTGTEIRAKNVLRGIFSDSEKARDYASMLAQNGFANVSFATVPASEDMAIDLTERI